MHRGVTSETGAERQLATLSRIAHIAIQDLQRQPMLQQIVDVLFDEFQWEFLACASVDLGSGSLLCEAVRSSLETDMVVGHRRPIGSDLVGECVQGGRTMDVDDTREHPGVVDTLHRTRAELCVPVIHDGVVLAVISAGSCQVGAFRGQRALLELVAGQIEGAIRVAQLLDELQRANTQLRDVCAQVEQLSRTDVLTGLPNRRCFDLRLAQALDEAARRAQPLALLMIDVDHFKAYNEGYGHPAGDRCLQEIAALCTYLLAGTPAQPARYGGEEFVVILPDSDLLAAATVAERLRVAVSARALEHNFAHGGLVTISIGVAWSKRTPPMSAQALIALADAALYEAKHAGRNCVRVVGRPSQPA